MHRLRLSWIVVLAALAAGITLAATPKKPSTAGDVKATLELNQQFFYAGDPFQVRLTITNVGGSEVGNPITGGLIPSFQVSSADGKRLEASGKPDAAEPVRPGKLSPKAFYGAIVDLSQAYPQLKSRGSYTLRWSADGISTDQIVVHVIPKFDPAKDYSAKVETEEGAFVIDLLKSTAPIAVKAFVDTANAGFYDGLLIHEVRPEQLIAGGDPTGSGGGQGPLRYPAELSAVPVVAGTVVLKPAGLAPPANASQFIVALRPEPKWTAQFTVLGQVVEGLDIVKRLANSPSMDRPSYRPVKDIHTLHITIQEKPTISGSGSSPAR